MPVPKTKEKEKEKVVFPAIPSATPPLNATRKDVEAGKGGNVAAVEEKKEVVKFVAEKKQESSSKAKEKEKKDVKGKKGKDARNNVLAKQEEIIAKVEEILEPAIDLAANLPEEKEVMEIISETRQKARAMIRRRVEKTEQEIAEREAEIAKLQEERKQKLEEEQRQLQLQLERTKQTIEERARLRREEEYRRLNEYCRKLAEDLIYTSIVASEKISASPTFEMPSESSWALEQIISKYGPQTISSSTEVDEKDAEIHNKLDEMALRSYSNSTDEWKTSSNQFESEEVKPTDENESVENTTNMNTNSNTSSFSYTVPTSSDFVSSIVNRCYTVIREGKERQQYEREAKEREELERLQREREEKEREEREKEEAKKRKGKKLVEKKVEKKAEKKSDKKDKEEEKKAEIVEEPVEILKPLTCYDSETLPPVHDVQLLELVLDNWLKKKNRYKDQMKVCFRSLRNQKIKRHRMTDNFVEQFQNYLREMLGTIYSSFNTNYATFHKEYNKFPQEFRFQPIFQAEQHLRLDELSDIIWSFAMKKKKEMDQEKLDMIKDDVWKIAMEGIFVTHSSMMQVEMRRYFAAVQVCRDYLQALQSIPISSEEVKIMPVINFPKLSMADFQALTSESNSSGLMSPKSKDKSGKSKEKPKSQGQKVEIDEEANSKWLESVYNSLLNNLISPEEASKRIDKIGPIAEGKDKSKKDSKNKVNKTPSNANNNYANAHALTPTNSKTAAQLLGILIPEEELERLRTTMFNIMTGENEYTQNRLQSIYEHAIMECNDFQSRMQASFQLENFDNWIGTLITNFSHALDAFQYYVRTSIENGELIESSIVFKDDKCSVNNEVYELPTNSSSSIL